MRIYLYYVGKPHYAGKPRGYAAIELSLAETSRLHHVSDAMLEWVWADTSICGSSPMSQKDLRFLIDAAKKHKITEEERDAQIRSFTYGNTHLENSSITRADVDKAVDSLKGSVLPWEVVNTESSR